MVPCWWSYSESTACFTSAPHSRCAQDFWLWAVDRVQAHGQGAQAQQKVRHPSLHCTRGMCGSPVYKLKIILWHIVAFEVPYHWTSIKGGAHTCFIDVRISNKSTKHVWAPPLTEVQWYSALNAAICDRNTQRTGIIFDFYMGRPHIVLWGDWAWMNPMLAYSIACLLFVAMHTVI